jgi:hypothetical protein
LRAQTLVEIEELVRAKADLRRTLELEPTHKEAYALLQKIKP